MLTRNKPVVRITFGLVGLTASLLLAAQLFGLIPDESRAILDGRRKIAESLAVQISSGAEELQLATLQNILSSLVERNQDVLSAALRDRSGNLVVSAGDHEAHWQAPGEGLSSPDDVQVPIFAGDQPWGTAEIAFVPMPRPNSWNPRRNAVLMLVLFTAGFGSIAYFLLLRRSLKALDPSAVIPERVRVALDALVEGVVILDESDQIVLANQSFAARLDVSATDLLGRNLSNLNWRTTETGGVAAELPWRKALQSGETQTGAQLSLRSAGGDIRRYVVNSTPIREAGNRVRGVLATFDDVTALEKRHSELQVALGQLKASQNQIELQNSELRFLAARDPLTGCLNRRAFFDSFEPMFAQLAGEKGQLSCVMIDIDRFKSVNDRYGHATGDKVIAYVAETLQGGLREGDLLARYGGEEFCMVFPKTAPDVAAKIVERLRVAISSNSGGRFTANVRVTVSAGISSVPGTALDPSTLVNQADTALYTAKQSGRNCLIRWDPSQTMRGVAVVDLASITGSQGPATGATTRVLKLQERVADLEGQLDNGERPGEAPRNDAAGLANKAVFRDRVEQALVRAGRKKGLVAVLYMELDLYERIENVLGIAAGDKLIEAVAERLAGLLRRSDTLALLGSNAKPGTLSRLGGDHFAVILDDLDKVEPITWIIQRIFQCLEIPLEVDGHQIFVTCAIGASLYPNDAQDAETLLRNAGAARQHAKRRLGPNCYAFYEKEMTEKSYAEIRLEQELHLAIERGEFMLHYQPKVSLDTGRITGVEALIRWQHPEKGLVSPATFIPHAEQTGLVNAIGDWVIRKACRQAVLWHKIGLEPVRIAVNLSPVQLRSESIVQRVKEILEETGLEAKFLELEITESALMEDLQKATGILRGLRNMGVHISLDDFGTGYSSLSYLKQLPVDSLKIDSSFVRDMTGDTQGTALVSAVIAMAQHLGIRVIAEGVETRDQLTRLRELDCDEVQGYLISRPLPVGEMAEIFRSGKPWRFVFEDSGRESAAVSHAATGSFDRTGNIVYMPPGTARPTE